MNAGTVTFVDGSTNLGSATVSNGVATLNASLAEGTHQIVATYSGTNTGTEFGISTGKYDQRVDTATTNPARDRERGRTRTAIPVESRPRAWAPTRARPRRILRTSS